MDIKIKNLSFLVIVNKKFSQSQDLIYIAVIIILIIATLLTLVYFYHRFKNKVEKSLVPHQPSLEEMIKDRTQELWKSEQTYKAIFSKSLDPVLIIAGNKFIDCNQAACIMLGYNDKQDFLDRTPDFISPRLQPDGRLSNEKANEMIAIAFKKGTHRFEWHHKMKSGRILPIEVTLISIIIENKQLLYVIWKDISLRINAEKQIEIYANYDSLTGLPNRRSIMVKLNETLITQSNLPSYHALIFIDLDRFKTINDSLGHTIGDSLLIEAASRIKQRISKQNSIARLGGDEFVILIEAISGNEKSAIEKIKDLSNNLISDFQQPIHVLSHELHVTATIGISIFKAKNATSNDLLRQADVAMFAAKKQGGNQAFFYDISMQQDVTERMILENDLRSAIHNKAFHVYYQPQVDKNGHLIGVEALLRWIHPKRGFISPELFIPVAEECGLIHEIGFFVLHKSLNDILNFNKEQNLNITLSINISSIEFSNINFFKQIEDVVKVYEIPKHMLTLELTETTILKHTSDTIETFQKLKDLGIRIALDDFGTGYSSLQYLQRLPLHEIKIDKSFVFEIEENDSSIQLIKTIISIAKQFNLEIVAEGVETLPQLDFLVNESCNLFQGFYFSEAISIEKLQQFLKKANA